MSIRNQLKGKTIAEIANQFGLTLRTLRYYEDCGLLAPTRIGTVRIYREMDERRVQLIRHGRRLGFTIVEIEALLQGSRGLIDTSDFIDLLGREAVALQLRYLKQQRTRAVDSIAELKRLLSNLSVPPSNLY